jgi:hypothetical protein
MAFFFYERVWISNPNNRICEQIHLSPSLMKVYRYTEFVVNFANLFKVNKTILTTSKAKLISTTQNLYSNLKATPQFFSNLKTQFPQKYNELKDYFQKTIGKNLDDALNGINIFDLSIFTNLTARIPTGNKLTNLKKAEFLTYGYKIKPLSGGLKTKIDEIIANGDHLGAKTEGIVDDIMLDNGYTILDGKYGSNNGYDGIYIRGTIDNPTEIVIIESKQFKYTNGVADDVMEHSGVNLSPPSGTTALPAQMSDGWIEYVRVKLDQAGKTDISQMIFLNKPKITKYVTAVDKTQGEINFLKLGAY